MTLSDQLSWIKVIITPLTFYTECLGLKLRTRWLHNNTTNNSFPSRLILFNYWVDFTVKNKCPSSTSLSKQSETQRFSLYILMKHRKEASHHISEVSTRECFRLVIFLSRFSVNRSFGHFWCVLKWIQPHVLKMKSEFFSFPLCLF